MARTAPSAAAVFVIRALCALFVLTLAGLAHPAPAADEGYDIFRPVAPASAPVDWAQVLRGAGVLGAGAGLDTLPADQQAAVAALQAARVQPSMATAVGLLAHYDTFSEAGNDGFRRALIAAAPDLFLMADAAKYELVLQTNKRIHAEARAAGGSGGIAVSLRVGSTAVRFAQWQQWVAAGRPLTDGWNFTDPTSGQVTAFTGMPSDQAYRDAKLFKSDDDVTNWATAEARRADTAANERLNGERAAQAFASVTAEILRGYPEEFRAAALGGRATVSPAEMKVEFLSPTQAVRIMATKALREGRGWGAPIRLQDKVDFLGEWILSDPEKYNGLYAEEQLHAWGLAKGYVTENVEAPLAPGSSKSYAESAQSGALKDITGSDVFPQGVKDPFGWMATNYRQIFVTHGGDLDSVAKYTLRMIDWWTNVNLTEAEIRTLAADIPQLAGVAGDFDRLKGLADQIRNAPSAEAKAAAIAAAGGAEAALDRLKGLNQLMMVAGQRKHLTAAAEALTRILQDDVAARPAAVRAQKPLTLDDILTRARSGRGASGDPYADFETVMDAFANGYANLPEDVARVMAQDIAGFVEKDLKLPNGEGEVGAATRLALLPVLKDGAIRARSVGTDMQADARGLADFAALARSDLARAIDAHLADMNQPDLNGYLLTLQAGGIKRRVARLLPSGVGGDGWPGIEVVTEIARPADVAADLKRIMWLGQKLGWTDRDFAERLAAYFNGPDFRQPAGEGAGPGNAYADSAMEAYLAFVRLFDRSASTTRFITMQGPGGEEVTVQIEGSRFADAEINLGYIVFQQTMRGAEGATKLWGIKGDIESIANFSKTLHSLVVASPDMDQAAQAKALATMAAEAYGGFTGLAEKFATGEWGDAIERHIGQKSLILGKTGGTVVAMLSTADDVMQSPESQDAVLGAMAKDLLIVWQPELAVVLVLHEMYAAGSDYLVNAGAKSDFLDLLVKNGEWEFPRDGTPPRLKRVIVNGVYHDDDAPARAEQCKARAANALAPKEGASFRTIGLEHLVKIPAEALAGGTPLCKTFSAGKCDPDPDRMVQPREAILTLFTASPHPGGDPVLVAVKDAINARVGWENLDAVRRLLTWDDGDQWTAARLASHGIYPPTPEDAAAVLRQPVRLDDPGAGDSPRDIDDQWIHAGIWTTLQGGGRKMLGYLASQYWVRRQYLIECVMLDPLIQEAGRRAQKESYEGIAAPQIRDRLAELDMRMRALDARVWPNIALSADPFRPTDGGGELADDQKLALYAHYLAATANERRDLEAIETWFKGPRDLWQIDSGLLVRAYGSGAATPGVMDMDELPDLTEETEAGRRERIEWLLQDRVETLLSSIADIVARYEDGLSAALDRIAGMRTYLAAGNGYDPMPAHLALLPPESFAPPPGGYGPVENHLFPGGAWEDVGLFGTRMEDALLSSRTLSSGLAAEGSLGEAVRQWEDTYRAALARSREDLGTALDGFRTTLAQDLGQTDLQIDIEDVNPFAGLFETYAEDLATRHPLWPRLLRQRFQGATVELVKPHAARVKDPEAAAVAAAMKRDNPQDAIEVAGVNGLLALGPRFETDAARIVERSKNLFDLDLKIDSDGPVVVSALAKGKFTAKPFAGPEDPVIDAAEIPRWSERNYWELVRDPTYELLPLPSPDAPDQTTPLQTCSATRPDPSFEAAVRFLPEPLPRTDAMTWPLVTPGAFKARVTVVGAGGVPLARKTVDLQVLPAELRGRLDLDGGPIAPEQGERLTGHVEGDEDTRPEFPLEGEGPFRTQLCGALSADLMTLVDGRPAPVGPATAAGNISAVAVFHPAPQAGEDELVQSAPVSAEVSGTGVFTLKDPLKLTLPRVRGIPVSVKVTDVSGADLPQAESTIELGADRHAGPGPVALTLKADDVLTASAEVEAVGGVAKGKSAAHTFDRETDASGIELKLEMPVYDTRNFTATGRFVLQPADAEVGGIDGGTIWSNILARAPQVIGGDAIEVPNLDVVMLANGFSLDALLRGTDDIQSLLRPAPVRISTLPRGGRLDLGEVPVGRFRTEPVDLVAEVSDWAGARIGADGATVTLDTQPMTFSDGAFRGKVSFAGFAERLPLKASVELPDGSLAERLIELTLAAIGDPLAPKPPARQTLRVPAYLPGSLQVTGQTELEGVTPGAGVTVDYEVRVPGGSIIDPWSGPPGERFAFDLSFPVRPAMQVEVRAKAIVDGISYEATATGIAPVAATGLPTRLDLGRILLRKTDGLLPVPDLTGMPGDTAIERFGDQFAITVHPLKPPPTEADAGRIFTQSPPPDRAEAPSRLPKGGVLTAGAYRKAKKVIVPDVSGQEASAAQGVLFQLGIAGIQKPGRVADAGETPGLVDHHTPAGGAEIDPDKQSVLLFVLQEPPVAATQPEPEPADLTANLTGGLVGRMHATRLTMVSRDPRFPTSLDCAAFTTCAPNIVSLVAKGVEKSVIEIEAKRNGTYVPPLSVPGIIVEEVMSDMMVTILLAVGKIAVMGTDLLFEGIDIGLVIAKAPDGTLSVSLPGAEDGVQQVLSGARVTAGQDGAVTIAVTDYTFAGQEMRLSIDARLTPVAPGATLDLTISGRDPKTGSTGSLSFTGDLVRGEVTPQPLFADLAAAISAEVEHPTARYSTILAPLVALEERLRAD